MTATADNLKRRIVLECSRVVEIEDMHASSQQLRIGDSGRVSDGLAFDRAASRNVARLWYLPTVGAPAGALDGEPINVDMALARTQRTPEPEPEFPANDRAKTGQGGRNTMLTREAGNCGELGYRPGNWPWHCIRSMSVAAIRLFPNRKSAQSPPA